MEARPKQTGLYHYFTTGASRIDRIYVTRNITSQITGTDILPAAFTDHNVVVLRIAEGEKGVRRCHLRWRLDPTMLREENLISNLRQEWSVGRKKIMVSQCQYIVGPICEALSAAMPENMERRTQKGL